MIKIRNKKYNTGDSSWNHDEKMPGYKEWHRYQGPCPDCGNRTFDYGGGWRCLDDYCRRSANNPAPSVGKAPEWWETNVNIKKDGNMWHAFYDDYTNPMESIEGFGETPQKAVDELLKEKQNESK